MNPEELARQEIDLQLTAAGWDVQDFRRMDLRKPAAVREYPLKTGEADYVLFADRKAVGVVEAKKQGQTLSGVAEQSEKYIAGLPEEIPHFQLPLPFHYESTGVETTFRDVRDPDSRSRHVFTFHRPETLLEWVNQTETLRPRLRHMPPLVTDGLRECQIEAITNLERSFAENRPRALIQMATGSGKTFTAISFIYRLIKHAGAKRVLFLVDRSNLGRQTLKEFQQYLTPDVLWKAYEQLDRSKVRGAGPHRLLTDIISLVRFTIGESKVLEPFSNVVDERFAAWMRRQERQGRTFTPEQRAWLEMIKAHITTSLRIDLEDFEYAPFHEKGGPVKVFQLFGADAQNVLQELNDVLAA